MNRIYVDAKAISELSRDVKELKADNNKLLALLKAARQCRDKYNLPLYFYVALDDCDWIETT